jgi:valyl-tRNA synthetase
LLLSAIICYYQLQYFIHWRPPMPSQDPTPTQELPKAYEAKNIDSKWYDFWKKTEAFKADPASKKPAYCIVIPPPNVTGRLHMGHALVNTLQDILIRWKRMQGYAVLWVPGTDHAGIATQTVVERRLLSQGKKRTDFTREAFLDEVWKWKESSESIILSQLEKLGCSCDWSRKRFTMDEGNNLAVRTMFKKLYEDKLIYRGDYLVNWDPITQTALADDEVEYEERDSFLWHFRYPLSDSSGYIIIATTRPETMLGDTAVAVSSKDERYAHLIGKTLLLPITQRTIPIIADHHVDPSFGSGAVKVTPAHDPNDYQIALRHQLPFVNILTPDGKINENGGEFQGLSIEEARKAIVEKMRSLGFLEKTEPHTHRVGISYRSKAVIEPYLSKQWFVKMDGFALKLREAVEQKKVNLIPAHWESTYFHWINHLRDWCISRQLWWGHRIPIWYHKDNPNQMICYEGTGTPPEVQAAPNDWIQDPDVLDTWFSSALWPFATLGWPNKTAELEKFYPNSVLVTGHDILFFWVARMILMGEYALGVVPFPETFLHGLIYGKSYWRQNKTGGISYVSEEEQRDYDLGKPTPKDVLSKWEKMSKSKGNIIDPLEMIDQYGTDAVRMALCASATKARQIDLDRRRFEEFKNFANKVWNGARFVLMNLSGDNLLTQKELEKGLDESLFKLEDRWILSSLNRIVKSVNEHLTSYTFDQAALEAYEFFWKEFCAFYVEISKPYLFNKVGTPDERINKQKILAIVLSQSLRLLHPIAPFITEELFQNLKTLFKGGAILDGIDPYTAEFLTALNSSACIVAPYPQVIRQEDISLEVNQEFSFIEQIVSAIRNIRGEMKLPPGMAVDIHIVGANKDIQFQIVENNLAILSALIKINKIHLHQIEPQFKFASTVIVDNIKISLPLPEELIQQEQKRLLKERERIEASIEKLKVQLNNLDFIQKAPAPLLDKLRGQLGQLENELKGMVVRN